MPSLHLSARDVPAKLAQGLDKLADELDVPVEFPAEVLAEADQVAASGPIDKSEREDLTQIPFVTIDPEGSKDLDQAMFIERSDAGYRVWYAIADVAAWVKPGGAIDQEARRRGQTYYAPNTRYPLHPPALSEGAASLLADGKQRPALVWQIDLDAKGDVEAASVRKAWVISTAQLTYEGVQKSLDSGEASETIKLLAEVGPLRQQIEIDRGGVSLNLPEQEIVATGDDWKLEFRSLLPVEDWNAQISLLTGFCAADIMIQHGVGLLRTLPPAQERDVRKLRRIAGSLGIAWPREMSYPDFVRSIDVKSASGLAMMNACTLLFRGAGYTVINTTEPDQLRVHAALAEHYAHVTAPLRRLVDRFAEQICVDLCAGREPAAWAVESLESLPKIMGQTGQRANKFERGIVDRVEALVLDGREGELFTGSIVDLDDRNPNSGFASIPQVAVEARVNGNDLELGDEQPLRLKKADPDTGEVLFVLDRT